MGGRRRRRAADSPPGSRYNARVTGTAYQLAPRRRAGLLCCCLAVVLIGCGPAAEVRLHQPHLTGRQRDLLLTSNQVHWASEQDVERVLAEFPLPGAATGQPIYVLYLRLPAGIEEPTVADAEGTTVRGFLIQTRGEYAGRSPIAGGMVQVAGTSQARGATRQLEIDLTCDDGTRIGGRLRARRDDYRVRHFETHRRSADVQAVTQPPPAAATDE